MGDAGSAVARFERAIKIGRPSIVLAAGHELPKPVQLRDAIRILLVAPLYEEAHPRRPPRVAGAMLNAGRWL
jgi:hypothetical protein